MKYLSIMLLFLIACNPQVDEDSSDLQQDTELYVGLDINGQTRSCKEMSGDIMCTAVLTEGEIFAAECKDGGEIPIECKCHDYICVKNVDSKIFHGTDINGDSRSCKKMNDSIACTEIYGEEDAFADECKERGETPVKCGCHDYICIEEQENSTGEDIDIDDEDKREDEEEYSGIDINGEERSCYQMDKDLLCTMVFTEGDKFAADCKESGDVPVKCGCHDYICMENSF